MKKLALLLPALLVVAVVASASQAAAPAKPAKAAAAKTHVVEAEVVSADATAKTLTIKGENGDKTMPVDAAAAAHLKTLKAGEKVKLTCRDNEKGEREEVGGKSGPRPGSSLSKGAGSGRRPSLFSGESCSPPVARDSARVR
jgi:Cu/Ag efflux protein CusF